MATKKAKSGDAAELRRQAEELAKKGAAGDAQGAASLSPEETQRLLHELRVHQIELEMQNEELRRTQVELDAARTRYFDLYDLAPVGYVTVTEPGLITEANLTATGLLGVVRGALVGRLFSAHVFKEDQQAYYLARKELFATGKAQAFSLRMTRIDGKAFWAYLEATAAEDEAGAPLCRIAISDITERKQLEDFQVFLALTHGGAGNEPFFDALARYLAQSLGMDFICIDRLEGDGLTAQTLSVWCDGKFEDNVSYALRDTPCGDVVGKDVCCFPASVCQYFPRDQVLQDLRAESYIGVTLWGHSGLPIGLIAVIGRGPMTNRTLAEGMLKLVATRAAGELERLAAEEALRESNELFSLFMQRSPIYSYIKSVTIDESRVVQASDNFQAMTGLPGQLMIGRTMEEFFPAEFARKMTADDWAVVTGGEVLELEEELNGRNYSTIKFPIVQGDKTLLAGYTIDITDRKRMEAIMMARLRLMRLAETCSLDELLRATLDEAESLTGSQVGFYHFVERDQITLSLQTWSSHTVQKMCTALGSGFHYAVGEAGVWADCLRERRPVIHNDYASLPNRKGMPAGHAPVIRELVVPVQREGLVVAVLGVGNKEEYYTEQDIAAVTILADLAWDTVGSKRAGEALKESERRLSHAMAATTDAIWEWNYVTGQTYYSPRWYEMLGYADQEIEMKFDTFKSLCHPDDYPGTVELLNAVLGRQKENGYRAEFRMRHKNGHWLWMLGRGNVVTRTESGEPLMLSGTNTDITLRKEADDALLESRRMLRYVLDTVPQRIFWKGVDLAYQGCNQSYAESVGLNDPDAIAGKTDFELHGVSDMVAAYRADDLEVISSKRPKLHIIEPGTRLDRTPFWADTSKVPMLDGHGDAYGVLGVLEDITLRKMSEDALRIKNLVFDSSIAASSIADIHGVITEINKAFLAVWGYSSKEEVVGRHIEQFLNGPNEALAILAALDATGQWEGDYTAKKGDGSTFIAHAMATTVRNVDGRVVGFQCAVVDITDHRRAEEALRESEREHRLLVQNLHAGVVVHAADTGILFANDMAARLLGLSLDQMTGKTAIDPAWSFVYEDLTRIPLDEYPVNRVLATRKPIQDTILGINRPELGDRVWVLVNAFPEFGAEACIRQVVVTFIDITERKQAEAERVKLEAQLQQAQKLESVGRLAGGVAHDFNNMLAVILGYTDMALGRLDVNSPLYGDLQEVFGAAKRSAALTGQLLAFARKQTVAPKVLDLNETVAEALKMLERMIGENIALDWRPGADLWPVRIDPSQIEQVLTNLCINARDAIAGIGRVTIETENSVVDDLYCAGHPDFAPGAYVVLCVSDSGSGMDQELLDHIFEPFFTTKAMGKGTGLGLAMIYGIVKQNGGFIDVCSNLGQGTSFNIHLPRYAGKARQEPTEHASAPQLRGPQTILLVEDEPAVLKITAKTLEHLGHTVLAADTPGRALRMAREHAGEISLLITDVVMPEMNGRDLAKNLLALYPGMKRMFMSGYTAEIIAHQGELQDGTHFIQKPFTPTQLAAKLDEVLGSTDGST